MILFTAFVCILPLFIIFLHTKRKTRCLKQEHFLITGGSSGIGLAFAIEATKRGASVTILARNKEKLDDAKTHIAKYSGSPKQKISAIEADVTWSNEALRNVVEEAETLAGPVTFLVNCAGTSICYRFEETPPSEFERMFNTNFMGSVKLTQVLVRLMKERRKGNIIFISSIAGLIGLYGYSAYSASKFALMGMAEALQMEVKPYNVEVTVSFPPDTDTPGYAEEMKQKLPETHLVSESAGLFSAGDVAVKTLNDALKGRFMSSVGLDGWVIKILCGGVAPASYLDLIIQVLSMGLARLAAFNYLRKCDRTLKKYTENKEKVESDK